MNIMQENPIERGSFEIIGSNLQDEGVRLSLTNRMIRMGVKWGSVENVGSKKLLVRLGGDSKGEIKKFHRVIKDNFERWLKEDIEEKQRLRKRIANPGITVTAITLDSDLFILPINLHSHALQCQQLRKGIDVFEEISITFNEFLKSNQRLNNTLDNLGKINRGLLGELEKRNTYRPTALG